MNPPVAARARKLRAFAARPSEGSLVAARALLYRWRLDRHAGHLVNNPVNGVELAKVPKMGTEEATEAVEAAERAFPAWAKLTAKQRSNILRKWFELIVANREDLALILTSEQGKPLAEALGEVDIGAAYIEFFAEEARRVYGETIPTQRPDARLLAIKQPIGVCGAITPWNFPELDDHPQGFAGAGGRLHRGAEARQRDAARRRWRSRCWPRRPACPRACSTS